jgi:hypothetical protein
MGHNGHFFDLTLCCLTPGVDRAKQAKRALKQGQKRLRKVS